MSSLAWSPERAAGWLKERGMFGMRPGLSRMEALLAELGDPQRASRTIHVVGTNGKSSTARFAAHLLAQRGVAAGAYLSPHLVGHEERVLLPGPSGPTEASPAALAEAVGRVAGAAARVEESLEQGDRVTQFEAVTAAAFLLIAESGAEAAAIEAGMGGRLDATNVLPAGVVALTSVGLDHMEWLGDDIDSIAGEKLAVVGEGDVLVVAAGIEGELAGRIAEAAARSGRAPVLAPADPGDGIALLAGGRFQSRNLALASESVDCLLGERDPEAVRHVAATVTIPGRLQRIDEAPETIVDVAHNPDGIAALAAEMVEMAGGRRVAVVFGAMADKDVAGMVDAILPAVHEVFATSPDTERALPAGELARLFRAEPGVPVTVVPDVRDALVAARERAGAGGLVLVTGSVHTVGEAISRPGERTVTSL